MQKLSPPLLFTLFTVMSLSGCNCSDDPAADGLVDVGGSESIDAGSPDASSEAEDVGVEADAGEAEDSGGIEDTGIAPDATLPDGGETDAGVMDVGFGMDAGTAPAPIPANFVSIPAGTFTMGSPDTERRYSGMIEPQHQVTLTRDFFMQSTEVTQAEWMSVMGYNPSFFASCGMDCPVDSITLVNAIVYVNTLSQLASREQCYTLTGCSSPVTAPDAECTGIQFSGLDCNGYRLPTEAEWEYAARAGTTTSFSSGDDYSDLDAVGWHRENSGDTPHPVAQKLANPWGLFDIHGNLWEFTHDETTPYRGDVIDPVLTPTSAWGYKHVVRGGAFVRPPVFSRSANRSYTASDLTDNFIGMRPVITAD